MLLGLGREAHIYYASTGALAMNNACIPDHRLRLLLLGELPEPDAQPLEEHLLACQTCLARTRSLRLDDTLVSALCRPGGEARADDDGGAIDQLVQRLSDRSHLATHSSLLDETQALAGKAAAGDESDLVARFEPPAGPDELGRLGGFRVLKLLGQGGMGAVFLAEDMQLRRSVALKLLRPAQAANPDAAERFLREARAAAAIRHDHVVTIYQVGQAQGMPFIAQELLEGETLEDRLKREGRIPVGEAIRIGREIAAGLAAAHERGLLHRDIKPGNIWLEARAVGNALRGVPGCDALRGVPGGGVDDPLAATERHRGRSLQRDGAPPSRTKLLDFGLARSQQGDEQLTSSGAILGTPAYMSPEQAQGQPLDARSDLFSLGGVLYRMVTGRLPFPGTDVLSTLRSLAVEEPPPARSLNPEVPRELSALIAELLHKERDERPASAAQIAARLATIESAWGGPLAGPAPPASRQVWRYALVTAAAAALIALAIFLTVKTPYGEVAVEFGPGVKKGDVKIEVFGNGDVQVADAKRGWTIDVKEGQYHVRLTASADRFEIDERTITVTRNRQTRVKVTLKPSLTEVSNQAAPPASGYALEFNGKDSYVDLPTLRYDGSHPITLEVTIVPFQVDAQGVVVGERGGAAGDQVASGVALKFPIHKWAPTPSFGAFVVGDNIGYRHSLSREAITPRRRMQVAGVRDGSTIRLFIDGSLQSSEEIDSYNPRSSPFNIGSGMTRNGYGAMPFAGIIDELRVSRVSRYAADYKPPPRLEADEHTLALYHFDEGAGDVLTDSSGNKHHGKIVNAKWVPGIAGGPPRAIAPFNADEANAHQNAWAEYLKLPVEYENSLGMKLRLIPPGEFSMGSSADEVAELLAKWDKNDQRGPECIHSGSPQHRVVLTRPIYAGTLEVTQQQYTEVMGANPAAFSKEGRQRAALERHSIEDTANFPVDSASWLDAVEFCRKLTVREKLGVGGGYRLPSEAEWEFACRGGTSGPFYSGDGESAAVAAGWFGGNSGGRPHAGGELAANAFGLFDMHGNLWEWMLDRRDTSAYARRAQAPAVDPQELAGETKERVLRGGNWRGIPDIGRSSFRDGRDEFHRHYDYGFRVWLPIDSLLSSAKADPTVLRPRYQK